MEHTDHDLLIKVDTKMSELCKLVRKNIAENSKQHEQFFAKIDSVNMELSGHQLGCERKFISARFFYWLIPFLIAGIISIASISGSNINEIGNLKTEVQNIEEKLDTP